MQAAALLPIEASQKQQGKGTANHMMPLNNWFRGNMESSLIQYHLLSPFTPLLSWGGASLIPSELDFDLPALLLAKKNCYPTWKIGKIF